VNAERFFTSRRGVIIAALTATFLWGSAFPAVKLSYEFLQIKPSDTFEQLLFAGYRFTLASIFILFFISLSKKKVRFVKATLKPLVIIAFFQTFLQYILFYIGLSFSTGIQGSIIAGTTSFFQIIFAHLMYSDDHINMRKIFGLMIGFTGVVFVNITRGDFQWVFGLGEGLLLMAMAVSAFGNILARNGSKKMDVSYLTAYQMLIGGVSLLMVGSFTTGFLPFQFTSTSFLLLIYLAFLSAAGFLLWNNVMKYNQVGKVSMYLFLVPVFGVFLSSVLLDEVIHMFVLLGLCLVVIGIIIVNRKEKVEKQKGI
jgi:drug/metabolite transporter (DMT)-like permease